MTADPIAVRYAETLFASAKAEGTLDAALQELAQLRAFLEAHEALRVLLYHPGLETAAKLQVLDRLTPEGWSVSVRAFLEMVITLGRAEYLPEIAAALQEAAERDQGRLRATVRTAHPVPEAVLAHVRRMLEQRERKTLTVESELDPGLIGGVEIRLGHRVIDGSVRRSLSELRQRLKSVRVH